tara:strand:- start:1295 stop:1900 length:606 start_codon:yes stop_codon:yes gene_type:complete
MYFEYLNERPLDILNYENICADQLLCWGEFSLEQLSEKVPPDVHLVIDAYPRTISLERKKIRSDCVLLLLPRWIYAREIKSLLSQIKSSPFDFLIRPHPGSIRRVTNLISNYKNASIESAGNLTECLSKTEYRFCVGFNSSAIFEALIHQGSVFQYLCGNDEFIIPEISSIRNLSDLSLKRVRSIPPERLSYYFSTDNPLT